MSKIYNLTIKPNEFIQTEILTCLEYSTDFQKAQGTQAHAYEQKHCDCCCFLMSNTLT